MLHAETQNFGASQLESLKPKLFLAQKTLSLVTKDWITIYYPYLVSLVSFAVLSNCLCDLTVILVRVVDFKIRTYSLVRALCFF